MAGMPAPCVNRLWDDLTNFSSLLPFPWCKFILVFFVFFLFLQVLWLENSVAVGMGH